MKTLYTSLIVAGFLVLTGCNTSSSGGKPGESGGGFKLKGPANTPETTVKHDTTETKTITVDAGSNFKENITFETKVDPSDKGVTATVEPSTWKPSDSKEVKLHIKASKEAAKGDYTIHVTGKPAKGEATTLEVKIKVPEPK